MRFLQVGKECVGKDAKPHTNATHRTCPVASVFELSHPSNRICAPLLLERHRFAFYTDSNLVPSLGRRETGRRPNHQREPYVQKDIYVEGFFSEVVYPELPGINYRRGIPCFGGFVRAARSLCRRPLPNPLTQCPRCLRKDYRPTCEPAYPEDTNFKES